MPKICWNCEKKMGKRKDIFRDVEGVFDKSFCSLECWAEETNRRLSKLERALG